LQLKFTSSARSSFLEAIDYIKKENPKAAVLFKNKAEETLSRLVLFPESGRKVPDFPDLPFREVIVPPYRFIYRKKLDTVWIITLRHSSRCLAEND
jgi:toxin ParE1/3/4